MIGKRYKIYEVAKDFSIPSDSRVLIDAEPEQIFTSEEQASDYITVWLPASKTFTVLTVWVDVGHPPPGG